MQSQQNLPAPPLGLVGAKFLARILGYTPEGVRRMARRGDIPSVRIRRTSGRSGYRFDPVAVAEAISDDPDFRARFLQAATQEREDLFAALDELLRHLPADEPIVADRTSTEKVEVLEAPDGRRWFRFGHHLYTFEGAGVLRVDRKHDQLERFQAGTPLGTPRLPALQAFAYLPPSSQAS
jgi:hypothetical protein